MSTPEGNQVRDSSAVGSQEATRGTTSCIATARWVSQRRQLLERAIEHCEKTMAGCLISSPGSGIRSRASHGTVLNFSASLSVKKMG